MMIQMTTALLLLYYKGDGFPEMMLKTIKENGGGITVYVRLSVSISFR